MGILLEIPLNKGGEKAKRQQSCSLQGVVLTISRHSNGQTPVAARPPPEAGKNFNGRDGLRRVRDGKPNMDAEHRVPTGSPYTTNRIFSQLLFVKGGLFPALVTLRFTNLSRTRT